MRNSPILVIVFYAALAACLWPLYVQAVQVVTYVQTANAAHKLAALPPPDAIAAAVLTALLIWAMVGAVMLYRKGLDSFAWLVVLLVLVPSLSQLALQYV